MSPIADSLPQALYVHIPFCSRKCAYCDFVVRIVYHGHQIERYLQALTQEISHLPDRGIQLKTLYLGGGTPSLLSTQQMKRLVQSIASHCDLSALSEWTLEVNPETVTKEAFQSFHEMGINRISLGVQSFDDSLLKACKRTHTVADVHAAYNLLRHLGFNNIGLDLIYGLPGQTLSNWQHTVQKALELYPEHLSLYALQVETGTEFAFWHRGKFPSDEAVLEQYEWAEERLPPQGYHHYEIANWALPGKESRHNLTYWKNLPFLAVGVGAHGYWQGRRYANPSTLKAYYELCQTGAWAFQHTPCQTLQEEMEETIFLNLRLLKDGLDCQAFEQRFQRSIFQVYEIALEELLASQQLSYDAAILRLPKERVFVSNEIFQAFI